MSLPQQFNFPDAYQGDTYESIHFTFSASSTTGTGLEYAWSSTTSGDPGAGAVLFNHATLSSVTQLNISETDADAGDNSALFDTWDDTPGSYRASIKISDASAPDNYAIYDVNAAQTDAGGYRTFPVTYKSHKGRLVDGSAVRITAVTPIDFSGITSAEILIQLRKNDRLYHTFAVTEPTAHGSFSTDPVILNLAPGTYDVDVQITSAAGVIKTYLRGECVVVDDVSRV